MAPIGTNSLVVLVDKVEKVPDRFGMTRVAWTLKYAGVNNVAILNGGQNQWVIKKRALSQDMVIPETKPYKAIWNKNLFVDKATVVAKLGKSTIFGYTELPASMREKKSSALCRNLAGSRALLISRLASSIRWKVCIKIRRRSPH